MQFALLFQKLRFFGRCSLDCVLTGADQGEQRVHWIECNGRWGGVSIPMTLANRLKPGEDPGLVIVQHVIPAGSLRTSQQLIELLSGLLFERNCKESGVLLLAPPSGDAKTATSLLALAHNQQEADELAERALDRLRS